MGSQHQMIQKTIELQECRQSKYTDKKEYAKALCISTEKLYKYTIMLP